MKIYNIYIYKNKYNLKYKIYSSEFMFTLDFQTIISKIMISIILYICSIRIEKEIYNIFQ